MSNKYLVMGPDGARHQDLLFDRQSQSDSDFESVEFSWLVGE
jgi:hypothetical protein